MAFILTFVDKSLVMHGTSGLPSVNSTRSLTLLAPRWIGCDLHESAVRDSAAAWTDNLNFDWEGPKLP